MAGIMQNGLWTMGFDMDPSPSQVFTMTAAGAGTTTITPYSFGYSWEINNNDACAILLNTNATTLIVGANVYVSALPAASGFVYYWYDATAGGIQVALRLSSTGVLQFYLGAGTGTTLGPASPAGTILASQWNYIETLVTISTTVGKVQCNVNSIPVIPLTSSLDTRSTANTYVNAFALNTVYGGATYMDDWYMLDTTGTSPLNTFLGPVQCRGEKPTSSSAVAGRNAWTPTSPTGVNYTNVGNIPASTTEYNFDSSPGDFDMFRYPTLPVTVTQVFAVNEWAVLLLDSAGVRTVALDCYSTTPGSATDNLGTAFTPLSAGTMYFQSNVVNPSGGAVWTVATAQAAELGVKTVT